MWKIEADRLVKEELEYEITLRGVSPEGTVKDLINTLRELINLETEGHSFKAEYEFKFEDEVASCGEKLKDIEAIMKDNLTVSSVRKLKTKFSHVLGRIERTTPIGEEQVKLKNVLLTLALKYLTDFKNFLQQGVPDPKIPADLAFQQSLLNSPPNASTPNKASSDSDSDGDTQIKGKLSNLHITKKIDIASWGLTFSGKSDSLSLNAFLERVDELCEARGVSKQQLFKRAFELFEGEAKIYYRSVKHKVQDWDSLCNVFREEFFRDGNKKIWEQIKARTQGSTETIAIYIAYMLNLFDRLSAPVDESVKIEIIRERIKPEYQNKLDLVDITSLDHLIQLGRRIEDTNRNISNFVAPSTSKNFIEVDLQYKDGKLNSKKRLDNVQIEESDKRVTFESSDDVVKGNNRRENSRSRPQHRETSRDKFRDDSRNKYRNHSQERFVNRNLDFDRNYRDNSRSRDRYDRDRSNYRRDYSRDRFNSSERSHGRNDSRNRDNSFNRNSRVRDNSQNRFYNRDSSRNRPSYYENRDYNPNRESQGRTTSRSDSFHSRSPNRNSNATVCYKCNGLNHLARHCTVKVKKCYTCGLVGYTRNDCVRCKPQENFRRN